MTACDGINQFFKSTQHLGIDFRDRLTPSPRPAQANVDGHIGLLATLSQFAHPSGNGVAGQPCCNSHGRDAAPTQRHRFGRCPMPPHTFVHHRKQRQVLDPNPFDRRCILHAVTIEQNQQADKGNLLNLFFRPALPLIALPPPLSAPLERFARALHTAIILRRGLNETFPLSGDSGIRVSKSARRSYVCFAPQGGGRWLGVVSNSRKTSDESSMRNARAIPISWFATRC